MLSALDLMRYGGIPCRSPQLDHQSFVYYARIFPLLCCTYDASRSDDGEIKQLDFDAARQRHCWHFLVGLAVTVSYRVMLSCFYDGSFKERFF